MGQSKVGQVGQRAVLTADEEVELALARSIALASEAGHWESVVTLGRELAERRRARTAPGVASIDDVRAKREGGRS